MRTLLARFALGLGVAVAGWALVDAIASRWSVDATPVNEVAPVKSDARAAALADPKPSKKSADARRGAPRPRPESSSASGEFVHANAPVVIPPGVSEIGFEPAGEAPLSENRQATSRSEREAPASGSPPAPAPPAASAGSLPASPLGAPASAEDEAITAEVRRKLEGAAPGRRIQVSTRQGVVTLSGAVDTEQQKAEAIEAARQTPGVARVEDRLVVLVS